MAGRSLIDIDHVVSLSDAWQKGAFRWTRTKRTAFANDPLNLLAVDYSANRQKGDGDAATWLPANKAYRCSFVARQVAVKARYGLWVTAAEKSAIARVLGSCPSSSAAAADDARPRLGSQPCGRSVDSSALHRPERSASANPARIRRTTPSTP